MLCHIYISLCFVICFESLCFVIYIYVYMYIPQLTKHKALINQNYNVRVFAPYYPEYETLQC